MERLIKTARDRETLIAHLQKRELPFTVSVTKKRTIKQNNLDWRLYTEIAAIMGDESVEYYRALCKLEVGVPILRAENADFRAAYDKHVRPLPWEQKMAFMMAPIDFPVTRMMTTKQQAKYIDGIVHKFAEQGILLTVPQ